MILGWSVFFNIAISLIAFSKDEFITIFPSSSTSIFFCERRNSLSIIFKAYLIPSFSTNSILLNAPLPKNVINLY